MLAIVAVFHFTGNEEETKKVVAKVVAKQEYKVEVTRLKNVNVRLNGFNKPGAYPEAKGYYHVITHFTPGENFVRASVFGPTGKELSHTCITALVTKNEKMTISMVNVGGKSLFDYTASEYCVRWNQYDVYLFKKVEIKTITLN